MEKIIVCFGDSNTYGYNAEDGSRFDSRFPKILEKILHKNTVENTSYKVIEEGLCGRTFAFNDPLHDGLCAIDYIQPCLESHSPIDLLIIMLGTNDTKQRFSATSRNIAMGARKLINKAKCLDIYANSSNILLIAPPKIKEGYKTSEVFFTMGDKCDEKSRDLIKELELIAGETNCHFLNSDEFLEMNNIDFMHLDEKNHKLMAEKLAELIPTYCK